MYCRDYGYHACLATDALLCELQTDARLKFRQDCLPSTGRKSLLMLAQFSRKLLCWCGDEQAPAVSRTFQMTSCGPCYVDKTCACSLPCVLPRARHSGLANSTAMLSRTPLKLLFNFTLWSSAYRDQSKVFLTIDGTIVRNTVARTWPTAKHNPALKKARAPRFYY